ncbi:homoserine kinase [Nesterenkonia sp. NBAIMH1]|uniref:homoserine kinase n=1 Tax=Nesterenkonia sp. NBAIMH1 TaxID=2600320 RepID=UPI0011B5C15E|nr:homoserine kinase [Nesterenkonia sp. NBAIMH1]
MLEELPDPLIGARRFTLTVPATSANLGPGYDSMGIALDLRDTVEVFAEPRRVHDAAQVRVTVTGEGAADLPQDGSHLVVSVAERILAERGYRLPDLVVTAHNVIPHSRGLGSSAAAIATAVELASQLLAETVRGELSADEQLQIGSRLEGHPDNYVPALRGGAAVSWERQADPNGARLFATARLPLHSSLTCVAAVPNSAQSTKEARQLLPELVPHRQAARNSSRSALLVHALTADPTLLLEATEDSLHQEYRRSAFPTSMSLVDALRGEGWAAVVSGAGPTVLVITTESAAPDAAARIRTWDESQGGAVRFIPQILPITDAGVTVESTPR